MQDLHTDNSSSFSPDPNLVKKISKRKVTTVIALACFVVLGALMFLGSSASQRLLGFRINGLSGLAFSVVSESPISPASVINCIKAPCPGDSGISVTSPVGKETWTVGETHKIIWSQDPVCNITDSCGAPPANDTATDIAPTSKKAKNIAVLPPVVANTVTIAIETPRPACLDSSPPCSVKQTAPYVVAPSETNDGVFEWNIPSNIPDVYIGEVQISVSVNNSDVLGRSAVFVLQKGAAQNFSVTNPAGGEHWKLGGKYKIVWTAVPSPDTKIRANTVTLAFAPTNNSCGPSDGIHACDPVFVPPYLISANSPNSGIFEWTVPKDLNSTYQTSGQIVVKINNTDISATSNNFNIDQEAAPQLQVTSPASGDHWQVGSTNKIVWTQSSGPVQLSMRTSKVNISFSPLAPACLNQVPACAMPTIAPYSIATNASNTGSFAWTIPRNLDSRYQGEGQITVSVSKTDVSAQSNIFNIDPLAASGAHPDGTLVVNVPGFNNPTGVFLIENGKLRPFGSAEVFNCLKYDWNKIVPANIEDAKLPLGAGMTCSTTDRRHPDGTLVVNVPGFNNPTGVFLIENGKLRPFGSAEVFNCLKYDWNKIVPANIEDAKLPLGEGMTCSTGLGITGTFPDGKAGETYTTNLQTVNAKKATCTFSVDVSPAVLGAKIIPVTSIAQTDETMGTFSATAQTAGLYTVSVSVSCFPLGSDAGNLAHQDFKWKVSGLGSTPRHPDGSLVINMPGENNPTGVYLIENGTRRPISSGTIFSCLGYNWNSIVPANLADAALSVGSALTCTPATAHPDGSLVSNMPGENNPSGVYLIDNGKRRAIGSSDIFICNGFDWSKVVPANSGDAVLPVGSALACPRHPDGSLVINMPGENNPTGVYLIKDGKRLPIGSSDIFICLGFDWNQIVPANSADASLPLGAGLTCLAHPEGSLVLGLSNIPTSVWLIENGLRRPFPTGEVFMSLGYKWSSIVKGNSADEALPIGQGFSLAPGTLIIDSSSANIAKTIYVIYPGNVKRPISSYIVFKAMGYNLDMVYIQDISTYTTGASIDSVMAHAPGTDIRSNGTIYRVTDSGRRGYPNVAIYNTWHTFNDDFSKMVEANSFDTSLPREVSMSARTAGQ